MNLSTILHRAATTLATAAVAATLSLAAPQAAQAGQAPVMDTIVTYQFTGNCFDCSTSVPIFLPAGVTLPPDGVGSATLVLTNYSGGAFDDTNFVSFKYQSVIFSFDSSAAPERLTFASGNIPGTNGGPGDIFLDFLNSDTNVTTHFEATSVLSLIAQDTQFLFQNWCVALNTNSCRDNADVGDTYNLSLVPDPVPEPASLALLGAGLLGLGAARRRRG